MIDIAYVDKNGIELYRGDIVIALETIPAGAIGLPIACGTLGIFNGSNDAGHSASISWTGYGQRDHNSFKKIALYEKRSKYRPVNTELICAHWEEQATVPCEYCEAYPDCEAHARQGTTC